MSVGSILDGGVQLIRTQPRALAVWAVIYVIVTALSVSAMGPYMTAIMAAQRQAAANAAMGIRAAPVFPAGTFGGIFISQLIFLGLIVIGFAAVVRAVARPTGDRFAYLRVGMDELRLIGLGVLLALLLLLAELAAILVIGVLVVLSALVMGRTGGAVVGVIAGIAAFAVAIYAQVRLSLAGALTVIERRIVIKDAWRATKGQFWTLFGVFLLIAVAYLIVTIVTVAITNPSLLTAYSHFDPREMQAVAQAQYGPQGDGVTFGYILRIIVGAVLVLPMAVITMGAIATAALEMGGVPYTVATEFE